MSGANNQVGFGDASTASKTLLVLNLDEILLLKICWRKFCNTVVQIRMRDVLTLLSLSVACDAFHTSCIVPKNV
jgi:hypothetical protein